MIINVERGRETAGHENGGKNPKIHNLINICDEDWARVEESDEKGKGEKKTTTTNDYIKINELL